MNDAALVQILSVGGLWALAVVTPGPNFLVAARIASARSRRAGLAAVAGIGAGTVLWGCAGAFGVRAMFDLAPRLYAALTMIGAAYLLFLGARIIAASFGAPPPGVSESTSVGPALSQGFLTSISNPKSLISVASLFAAVMPQGAGLGVSFSAVAVMVTISVVWYSLVVCLLTTRRAARAFAKMWRWIDRFAGCVFMAFGARLIIGRLIMERA